MNKEENRLKWIQNDINKGQKIQEVMGQSKNWFLLQVKRTDEWMNEYFLGIGKDELKGE